MTHVCHFDICKLGAYCDPTITIRNLYCFQRFEKLRQTDGGFDVLFAVIKKIGVIFSDTSFFFEYLWMHENSDSVTIGRPDQRCNPHNFIKSLSNQS
jgi:hypothetical protein